VLHHSLVFSRLCLDVRAASHSCADIPRRRKPARFRALDRLVSVGSIRRRVASWVWCRPHASHRSPL